MKTISFKHWHIVAIAFLFACTSLTAHPQIHTNTNRKLGAPLSEPNAWINEFHYDNTGSDVGEMIEVVIENIGDYTLSDFTVTLYNGSNETSYDSYALNTFDIGVQSMGFAIYSKQINGIQNGAPDGIALSYEESLIQFLSYEGSLMASNGPAAGKTSIDVGITEDSSTPIGYSLYLRGTGSKYADFTWAAGTATRDTINTDQVFDSGTSTPQLIVSQTTLNALGYLQNEGPGTPQTFSVSGLSLTDDITITPPTNYEISTDGTTFQSTTLVLKNIGGIVTPTTILVRLKTDLKKGKYFNEEIIITSFGTSTQTVNCNGEVSEPVALPNAWINEFHYDNAGADVGEMIEIVIENADEYTLAGFTLSLYNGGDGKVYGTHSLSTFNSGIGMGNYSIFSKTISGIQNGPDGFALDYNGTVISFISYKGSFTANNGSVTGQTSDDIGITQDGSTPAGNSLYLCGVGNEYTDFSWSSGQATANSVNNKQLLDSGLPFPQLYVSKSAFTNMGYAQNQKSKISKTFTVSGLSLKTNITITPPTNYEISLNGINFQSNTIILNNAGGVITPTTITVQLKNNLLQGDYNNQEIEITSAGATTQIIRCSGTVSEPIIIPNVWINEFHYDNASIDVNEFVEVLIEKRENFDLSKITLSLYNESNGSVYGSVSLNNFTLGAIADSFSILSYNFTNNSSSLQNGPDGFSLDYDAHLIQFLSYEGIFEATEGPASGYTSTDVGVEQKPSNKIGQSLQLLGCGLDYNSFEWISASENQGKINSRQLLLPEPPPTVSVSPTIIVVLFVLLALTKLLLFLLKVN